MLNQYDRLVRRCPMLGNEVPFSYCRQPGQEMPCRKLADCWWEALDIQAFIAEHFNEEVQNALGQPSKPKMLSILEIIEQARKKSKT
jgi:hypothetical protein